MKKVNILLTLSFALAIFPAFFAVAESIEVSSNIVGYQEITLQEGYNLVGLNFRNTGEDVSYNVQDLIDTSALQGGVNLFGSDRLYLWDAAAQEYVTLWLEDDTGKWVDSQAQEYAGQEIYPGDAMFMIVQEVSEIVFSGEVMDDSEIFTHAALDGFSMIASAWPVDIAVQDIDLTGLQGGSNLFGSDRLYLWDTATQEYVTLWLEDDTGKWVDSQAQAYADQIIPEPSPR